MVIIRGAAAAAAVSVALAANVLTQPKPVDVPLRLVNSRPLLDVKINGSGPYTFLFDTGASGQARADTTLVDKLKLEVIGEARGSAGIGGQVVAMPIVQFKTLALGDVVFTDVSAASRDYNQRPGDAHIDGVIGLNLFADHLVTLDFPKGVLRIETGALPEPNGRDVLAFANPRRIAEVTLQVGGIDVQADVDTGGMGGLALPLSLAEKLKLMSPPKVVGRAMTVSGPMEMSQAPLDGTVTIGRHVLANPPLEFTPAMPHGNLGIDVLSQFALTIDQKNKRIRFARDSDAPITLTPRARTGG